MIETSHESVLDPTVLPKVSLVRLNIHCQKYIWLPTLLGAPIFELCFLATYTKVFSYLPRNARYHLGSIQGIFTRPLYYMALHSVLQCEICVLWISSTASWRENSSRCETVNNALGIIIRDLEAFNSLKFVPTRVVKILQATPSDYPSGSVISKIGVKKTTLVSHMYK